MRARFALIVLLGLSVPAVAGDETKTVKVAPTEKTKAQTADLTIPSLGGFGAAATNAQPAAAPGHTVYIAYESWSCDVDWNEECSGEETVEAPAGYQVCKAVYTETTHDGANKEFKAQPASAYPNDPENPDRFRAVYFRIFARGNHNPFDQHGSKEVVENVGIDMIRAEADNYTRYREGCWMPNI